MSARTLIRSKSERDDESGDPLYWSNLYGWCGLASADRFSADDARTMRLPDGGEWITAPDPAAFVMLPSPAGAPADDAETDTPAEDDAPGTLGTIPVDRPGRANLRELYGHLAPRALLARTRRFMTRTYFDKAPAGIKPLPTYKQWLRLACTPSRLSSDPPKYPDVPYGTAEDEVNALARNAYYLREFDRLNNLKGD